MIQMKLVAYLIINRVYVLDEKDTGGMMVVIVCVCVVLFVRVVPYESACAYFSLCVCLIFWGLIKDPSVVSSLGVPFSCDSRFVLWIGWVLLYRVTTEILYLTDRACSVPLSLERETKTVGRSGSGNERTGKVK